MFNHILIVCVGNICRSPIVEGLLAHYAKEKNLNIKVSSSGISAVVNSPAHPISVEILKREGIDISQHRARQLDADILREADLVLVMEEWHQKEIACAFPSAYGKVHTLGKWSKFDIPDPIGRSQEYFEETFALIQRGVAEWQKKLWSERV